MNSWTLCRGGGGGGGGGGSEDRCIKWKADVLCVTILRWAHAKVPFDNTVPLYRVCVCVQHFQTTVCIVTPQDLNDSQWLTTLERL